MNSFLTLKKKKINTRLCASFFQSLFEIFVGIGYAAGPLLGSALYGV
jgi:hypothetical protein